MLLNAGDTKASAYKLEKRVTLGKTQEACVLQCVVICCGVHTTAHYWMGAGLRY